MRREKLFRLVQRDHNEDGAGVVLTMPVTGAPSEREERSLLLEEVRVACNGRKYEAVESLYRRLLTLDEQCPEAWYGLGMLSLQRGGLDEAYDYLSEYTVLESDRQGAETGEAVLFFLERLMGAGEELPPDLLDELDDQFLVSFAGQVWLDGPLSALEGLSPREAVRTRDGRGRVLELMRDMECFYKAVVEKVLAADRGMA